MPPDKDLIIKTVNITDYDASKHIVPFPKGLISYLPDSSDIVDNKNAHIITSRYTSNIGEITLDINCKSIQKRNDRLFDIDLLVCCEEDVKEIASYIAGGEIKESDAINAINSAVSISDIRLKELREALIKALP